MAAVKSSSYSYREDDKAIFCTKGTPPAAASIEYRWDPRIGGSRKHFCSCCSWCNKGLRKEIEKLVGSLKASQPRDDPTQLARSFATPGILNFVIFFLLSAAPRPSYGDHNVFRLLCRHCQCTSRRQGRSSDNNHQYLCSPLD